MKTRHSAEQIVAKLRQADLELGKGLKVPEHLQVPKRQCRRRRLPGGSENNCIRHKTTHRNHVRSYDFLADRT